MNELVSSALSLGPAEATLCAGECTVAMLVSVMVARKMEGGLQSGYVTISNSLAKNAERKWMRKLSRPERRIIVFCTKQLPLLWYKFGVAEMSFLSTTFLP